MDQFFRASVGALIVDEFGRVLACHRSDIDTAAWQLPQGGIKHGEEPLEAVYREIEEETAITRNKLELIVVAPEWLTYELPIELRSEKTGRGQTQKWCLLRFHGRDEDIRPNPNEFRAYCWLSANELLTRVVAFRRAVYTRIFALFASYLQGGEAFV